MQQTQLHVNRLNGKKAKQAVQVMHGAQKEGGSGPAANMKKGGKKPVGGVKQEIIGGGAIIEASTPTTNNDMAVNSSAIPAVMCDVCQLPGAAPSPPQSEHALFETACVPFARPWGCMCERPLVVV